MGVTTRYLFGRVLGPLVAVSLVVGSVVSLWQLSRVSHLVLVSFSDVELLGRLIVDLWPGFAPLALGTAGLFGTMLAYDRLAEDGEMTALAASAVSPLRIFGPAFMGGVVMAMAAWAAGVWGEPWGVANYRKDVALLATRAFSRTLTPGRFKPVGYVASVYVEGAEVQANGGAAWQGVVIGRDTPQGPALISLQTATVEPAGPGLLTLASGPGQAVLPSDKPSAVNLLSFERAAVTVDVLNWVQSETMHMYDFQEWDLPRLWAAAQGGGSGEFGKLTFHLWQKLCAPLGVLLLCLVGGILGGQRAATARGRGYLISAVAVAGYFGVMGLSRNLVIQDILPAPLGANISNLLGLAAVIWLWRTRATRWG